ncbi:hypothetical protein YH63_008340 [Afipia massiliensis]|uniref:Uncharacterized protein n=1 Tax=Afipia massiliensis TaxID=211460 RepID=A0A4U6BM23_9BRAD|nr:hypothetical protein [Afipia massiliensis]TKT71420.1 hypothetical protein YH63_008340 [Afipia massiliensis]
MILLSGLIGALIGALVGAIFNFWKMRRDEFASRCDEVCEAVHSVALEASEYWSTKYDEQNKALLAEARIRGAQDLCDGLYAELRLRFSPEEAAILDELMSELLDALTGGEFTEEKREADVLRTRLSMQTASAVILGIRKAHHNTMPFSSAARTMGENRHRSLSLPTWWKEGKTNPALWAKPDT